MKRERTFSFSLRNALLQHRHIGNGYISTINPPRSIFIEGICGKPGVHVVILLLRIDSLIYKTERGKEKNNWCSQNDANSRQGMDGKKDREWSEDKWAARSQIGRLSAYCRKFVPAHWHTAQTFKEPLCLPLILSHPPCRLSILPRSWGKKCPELCNRKARSLCEFGSRRCHSYPWPGVWESVTGCGFWVGGMTLIARLSISLILPSQRASVRVINAFLQVFKLPCDFGGKK